MLIRQLYLWIIFLAIATPVRGELNQEDAHSLCPEPLLSQLQTHTVVAGESVPSIASKYNLSPQTIRQNNPDLTSDQPPPGTDLTIPPVNGIVVSVPAQATWQDLAAIYGVRADLLFEVNGCQPLGQKIFVPGVTWNPTEGSPVDNYTGLSAYPLSVEATIGLAYGWEDNSDGLFHSGLDLLTPVGTPVIAAEAGTVVFVGQEGNYGNLIIINHQGKRQTRYAHLQTMEVEPGQIVAAGDPIGTVGTTGLPDLEVPHLHFEVRYQTPMGWMAQDPLIHFQRDYNLKGA